MTFKYNDHEWGSTSTNLERPTNAEIAAGHVKNSIAKSSWVNWHSSQVDIAINAANKAAQAASGSYPTPYDKHVVAGGLQYSKEYSTQNPDSDLCKLYIPTLLTPGVTPGWNHTADQGCVYFIGSGGALSGPTAAIYRVNTWDVGELAVETLDLDLTYVGSIEALVCDRDYVYIGYNNTNTGHYHIAQLSTVTWTGLAVADQDTGWTTNASNNPLMLALARPGVVGAYHSNSGFGTFGVWKVGTSWTTGVGNLPTVSGDFDTALSRPELQATYDSLYTVVRTNYNGVTYCLVNCDVDAPGSATQGPASAAEIWNAGTLTTSNNMSFRAFSDRVIFIHPATVTGPEIFALFDDGSSDWTLRALGDIPLNRSTYAHSGRFALDGNGRLWYHYRLSSLETESGREQLVAAAFDPWVFDYDYVAATIPTPSPIIPMGSSTTDTTGDHWILNDGRNLVSIEKYSPGPGTVFRVITTPGLR
jgi:hypothetical protein